MSTPKIRIKTDGFTAKVFVDGKKLEGVRAVRFSKNGLEPPVLNLEMKASDIEIEGNIIPALPEVFKPFYVEREPPEDGSKMSIDFQGLIL